MPRVPRVPSYRLHKPSGQAVITVAGPGGTRRDVYLGVYNTPDSRREYARVVAELATAVVAAQVLDPVVPTDLTVDEVLVAFWAFADRHYRRADGTPTHEPMEFRQSLKPLRALYGHTPAREFGPLGLKAVRDRMIAAGWCRRLINQRVGRVRRVFKWAASEQLVPVTTFQALATVAGLQKGRTAAQDPPPIEPVPAEHVRATLPFLGPHVRGLVEVQFLTGMRPDEVCRMRPVDVDTSGPIWAYRPAHHKLGHRGKDRVVRIGPKAQAVLAGFTPPSPADYFFSPRRAVEEFHDARSAARRTPRYPAHLARNAAKRVAAPKRRPADRYTASSYGHAVTRAVERVNRRREGMAGAGRFDPLPHWAPNQLRHAHATEVRRRFGLEAAQVALGHERADVTQVYAERNAGLAEKVAAEIG
ncbi:MAG: site-specific tyrosine recombinase XerD [Gemmataceae bacterium]|nr:site-specific tyrosine recombinase XerD [Gemmataceae bacterium]